TDLAQIQLVARRTVNEKRPSIVSVIAPAGTGKTRLVEEFLEWLPHLAPDALVATAQCLPYGQQLTYWPMRQVILTLTGLNEDASPAQIRDAITTWLRDAGLDRKSTRLNSSHVSISYAVFCLKKKNVVILAMILADSIEPSN